MDIQPGTLDSFWLTGASRISSVEEIDFLRRVHSGKVPFSAHNRAVLKQIMLLDSQPTYKLYGKTGWAGAADYGDGKALNIGWLVGYVETKGNVYFFATNIESPSPVPDTFIPARRRITERILKDIGVI